MTSSHQGSTERDLRVCVLASGSSGNATLVCDGTTTVLVDAGISARETYRRAESCGIAAGSISAIILTHEHNDHVRGVRVLAKRTGAVVYATDGTRRGAQLDDVVADIHIFAPNSTTKIGSMCVTPFPVAHDAAEPVGVRIDAGGRSLGMATDTGEMTEEAYEVLAGCEVLGIEANHDAEMLSRGPYPYFLKRRIASAFGHLANAQAAEALERLAHDRLRRVFALHVSRTNNTYDLAALTLAERLAQIGLAVPVAAGRHDSPCDPTGPRRLTESML